MINPSYKKKYDDGKQGDDKSEVLTRKQKKMKIYEEEVEKNELERQRKFANYKSVNEKEIAKNKEIRDEKIKIAEAEMEESRLKTPARSEANIARRKAESSNQSISQKSIDKYNEGYTGNETLAEQYKKQYSNNKDGVTSKEMKDTPEELAAFQKKHFSSPVTEVPYSKSNSNSNNSDTKSSFKEAFAKNRKDGNKVFEWQGKKYTTELAKSKKELTDTFDNQPKAKVPEFTESKKESVMSKSSKPSFVSKSKVLQNSILRDDIDLTEYYKKAKAFSDNQKDLYQKSLRRK